MNNWTSVENRLLRNCDKTDSCWNWLGATRMGYGRMVIGSRTDGSRRYISAHRAAYREWKGEIIKPMVLHTCDNRRCINPNHLYNGTHQDNVRDAIERKRFKWTVGQDNGNASITNHTAKAIKRLLITTELTCKQIGKLVGCSRDVVKGISSNKSWRDILSPEPPETP